MPAVDFRLLTPETLPLVEPWFDDAEVRGRLGDRSWPARAIALQRSSPGSEFRGRRVLARHAWIAYDAETPVGLIDAEVYDRRVPYDGSRVPPVDDSRAEPGPVASFALVVDPARQREGYGRAMIRALIERPEMRDVRVYEAAAEPDNPASIRCLEAAGLQAVGGGPDWEGMLPYVLRPGVVA
jgi:RimJ/RimL family protein N-acetyltransferase